MPQRTLRQLRGRLLAFESDRTRLGFWDTRESLDGTLLRDDGCRAMGE